MKVTCCLVLGCLTLLEAGLAIAAEGAGTGLRAGAAVVDITPRQLPIRVAGSIGERHATAITDRLHARSLVFESGSARLAICIVDSCLIPRVLLDAAKARASNQTGIPSDQMLIAATHTHSAPAVAGVHGNDPVEGYAEWLQEQVAQSIIQAWHQRVRARVGWGSGRCEEWVFCRRWIMKPGTAKTVPFSGHETNQAQMNPGHNNSNKVRQTGPVDPEVTVLSVQTIEGQPLALLANYSTHYAGAPEISADYFGEFARIVEQHLQASGEPRFVAIMCNGTSGDANCLDFSKARRPFTHRHVAEAIAAVALKAIDGIAYSSGPAVAMAEAKLTLGVRTPTSQETAEAQAWLEKNLSEGKVKTWEQNYARETVLLSRLPPTRELKLQALRIGDFAITAIPCEVYGSTGLQLKKASPFAATMNISMANGAEGYLPPPDQHPLGGYTTWRARTSCLEVGAEPKITRTLLTLLSRVAGSR